MEQINNTVADVKPTIVPEEFISMWRRHMLCGMNQKGARTKAIFEFKQQYPEYQLDVRQLPRRIEDVIGVDRAAKLTSNDTMIQSLMTDSAAFAAFIIPQVEAAGNLDIVIEALKITDKTADDIRTMYDQINASELMKKHNETIAGDGECVECIECADLPSQTQPDMHPVETETGDSEDIPETDDEPVDNMTPKLQQLQAEYDDISDRWLKKDGKTFLSKASDKVKDRYVELREILQID